MSLEICKLSSSSINVRLSAVRKPALEAAQNGLLDYALAAGILGVKGVKKLGVRIGQWLSLQQAQTLAFQNRHLLTQCWNLQSQIGSTREEDSYGSRQIKDESEHELAVVSHG